LAKDLGPKKIRANSINPGGKETEGAHALGVATAVDRTMMMVCCYQEPLNFSFRLAHICLIPHGIR
jgi:NAD(P)-dependent dehydrogenase (short-subunit alcohol dehydrogenase family)